VSSGIARMMARRGVLAALSDPTGGINEIYGVLAAENGLDQAVKFDFEPGSENVVCTFVSSANDVDISQVAEYPALSIYTSDAKNANIEKSRSFSGLVTVHVDGWIRHQARRGSADGMPFDDTETVADVLEAAISKCITDFVGWESGVVYNNEFQFTREPVLLIGDGWQQRIAGEFYIEVHV
jgi:Tfp pilus assembly major pilin PilA